MEQSEIEILVGELETRVDRLRALYEQYFMGIERIEPGVARKDVERRFQTLRREQIRNTALRFRFQMVVQRYNTYQSYWIRVCRQIEEGTYKRDLGSANKRGEMDARRRRTGPGADPRRSVASDDEVAMELDSELLESVPPPSRGVPDEEDDFLPLIRPGRAPSPPTPTAAAPPKAPAPGARPAPQASALAGPPRSVAPPPPAAAAKVPGAGSPRATSPQTPAALLRPTSPQGAPAPAASPRATSPQGAPPAPGASPRATSPQNPPATTDPKEGAEETREEKMRKLAAQIKATRRTGPGTPSR